MDDFEKSNIKAIKYELDNAIAKFVLLDDFPNFMVIRHNMTDSPEKKNGAIDNFYQKLCSFETYDKCQQVVGRVKALRSIYKDMMEEDKKYNAYKGMNRCAIFEWLNDQLHELSELIGNFRFHDLQYTKLENAINESFHENSKCREFGAIRHEWYRVNAYTNMMLSIIQFAAFEVVDALYECVDVKVTEPAQTLEGLKVFFYDTDDVLTIQQWMLEEARK